MDMDQKLRVRTNSVSESQSDEQEHEQNVGRPRLHSLGAVGSNKLGHIPEDEKVSTYSIGVHNHDNFVSNVSEIVLSDRRSSYSLQRNDFSSDDEHRHYLARKRWRKVRIFMKAMYRFSRRETYPHVDSSGSVFWKIKLLYALPQFSLISLTMLINIQVIVFYNEIGVSLAFLSFFQIFARSFDVLTDPLMAHISDNLTRTKWGRRIPWMCIGAPFYAIAFMILMSPPTHYDPAVSSYNMPATYWFGASYLLFYLCDTVANIPLLALGPELSDDSDHRTSLFMWVKLFEGVGTIVGGGAPVIFISGFGLSKKASFQLLAVIFGGWYVVSMFLLIRNVKEREQSTTQQAMPFVASISRSFRNIAFRPLAVAWVLDFCALAMIVAVLPFFIRYYVQAEDPDTLLSIAIVGFFLSGFACIPLWKIVAGRGPKWYHVGKRNAWLLYNLLMCVTNFLFCAIGEQQSVRLVVFMCLNGIPVGGQFLIMSIVADVIDYDELLNFTRNEGAFTVFSQFVPKLVAIPAQSFPLIVLFMLNFQNPTVSTDAETGEEIIVFHQQNQAVRTFLRVLFAVMPSVIACISFVIKRQYFPIRTHAMVVQISDGITKHMQGLPAIDPITQQTVEIEEYTRHEQQIVDLLDHFTYTLIIWLLEPNTILKKHHKQHKSGQGQQNRRMSFQAISNLDFDVKHFLHKLNAGGGSASSNSSSPHNMSSSSEIRVQNNHIAPGVNRLNPIGSEITSSSVRVVADPETNTIETSYFKSMGKRKGVRHLQQRMLWWVLTGIACVTVGGAGVAMTLHWLHSVDKAFIPALFCLCIGTSSVFTGFNLLRLKAAKQLEKWVEDPTVIGADGKRITIDIDDLLKRVIYPKIKGQRGGGFVWNAVERTQIDVLVGDVKPKKHKIKKLKRFQQKLLQLRRRRTSVNRRQPQPQPLSPEPPEEHKESTPPRIPPHAHNSPGIEEEEEDEQEQVSDMEQT